MRRVGRRNFLRSAAGTLPALTFVHSKAFCWVGPGRVFYVNSGSGDDSASGSTEKQAWKSLNRVNETVFQPGDRILFRSGMRFTGSLRPKGSGKEGEPIIVDQYGVGPRPLIEAEGRFGEALLLSNQEYWEVSNLQLTNLGPKREEFRYGVRLNAWDSGTVRHIVLRSLEVRDVNGSLKKNRGEGQGIVWENGGDRVRSRFDGLLIENCRLLRTDRNGICGYSAFSRRSNWYPSLNVVIRGNRLEDIGGDCIKPWGCDGALVEYNVVSGGRTRCEDAAAGIWPWSSDNTVVQFNEVSGVKGKVDGQGFDSDFNCRNSLFQYNYSHDNEGGFFLVCTPAKSDEFWGTQGTVIRYNISQNDGTRTFHMAGPTEDTHIYNNTIYVAEDLDVHAFLFTDWSGWAKRTFVRNNIFYADGILRYSSGFLPKLPDGTYSSRPGYGQSRESFFSHNVFFGLHEPPPAGENNLRTDPGLVRPGSGSDGFESLRGYRLKGDSPCIGAGIRIENNGGRDFWASSIPEDRPPSIGACN